MTLTLLGTMGLPDRAYVRHTEAKSMATVTAGPYSIPYSDESWYTVIGDGHHVYMAPESVLEQATGADAGVPKGHRHHDCPVVRLDGYPYECVTADRFPHDWVFVCRVHECWWSIDPATGEKRQTLYERHPS